VTTYGGVRTVLNGFANAANQIADQELGASFITKLNWLNNIENVVTGNLFAASEPGVWFDPSDLTTLFQDSAGTTPVTAPGQPVGLMLDKSQGIALGPELVTNGNFASPTGWTVGTNWSISGGQLVGSSVPAFTVTSQSTAALVAGKTYEITYDVVAFTAGVVRVVFSGGTQATGVSRSSTGSFREVLVANGGNNLIAIGSGSGGFTGSVDNISVKLLPGNHATQSTSASRPTYLIDGTGRPYLRFDGVDDGMVTPTITPGTDKVQAFSGVRKLSDAAAGIFCEFSANTDTNNGSFRMTYPPNPGAAGYGFFSKGTLNANASVSSGFAAPITNVVTGIGDISGDVATIRVNGVQRATVTTDQGITNYLAYPLYLGRRGGTTLPLNGNFYSLIVRFGANLTTAQISQWENYTNDLTGAY
jgi:hypothetical protein